MNATRIRTLARRLATARPEPRGRPASDAELLTRFLDGHDEPAFEELVGRHAPMVRAVCRSLLRDPNDVDDAVQATLLVLVRRADAVRNRLALGGWLCRVAWRTANHLREANARRADRRAAGVDPDATPGCEAAPAGRSEVAAALDDEIGRLPERYRVAVLACYAAGTPTAEAAARLGWPKGTLLTRLAWARKRLRDRLARRGVTLGGGFAAVLGDSPGRAAAAVLAGRIARAAVGMRAGDPAARELVSERVLSLTEGVVRAMIGTKTKLAVGLGALAVALLGLGLGRMTVGTADAADPGGKKAVPLSAGPAAKAPAAEPDAPVVVPAELPKADAQPAGPGNDLVVRRPRGTFTREIQPYGKATLTFTEDRLYVHATVNVEKEKVSITVALDADYSLNRESMVYGVITGADISSSPGGMAAEAAPFVALATDLPFAFRIRVEDDAITIKDLKAGPLGSPLLAEAFGKGDAKDMMLVSAIIGGKYKADPNPGRNPPPPAAPPRKQPPATTSRG